MMKAFLSSELCVAQVVGAVLFMSVTVVVCKCWCTSYKRIPKRQEAICKVSRQFPRLERSRATQSECRRRRSVVTGYMNKRCKQMSVAQAISDAVAIVIIRYTSCGLTTSEEFAKLIAYEQI